MRLSPDPITGGPYLVVGDEMYSCKESEKLNTFLKELEEKKKLGSSIIKVRCVMKNKYNDDTLEYYSYIPYDGMSPFVKMHPCEYFEKLKNFNLKMERLSTLLCNGIDGELTTNVLNKELDNLFNHLDKLYYNYEVLLPYVDTFKNDTTYGKQVNESVCRNAKKLLLAYENVFDLFNHEVNLDIDEIDLTNTMINIVNKKFTKETK